jgi:polygalacturonase
MKLAGIGLLVAVCAMAAVHDVRKYGARGDGVADDTAAIQKAIEAAAAQGGGTVRLPPGRYRSGTLRLRDHLTLDLSAGAVLLASPDDRDFAPYEKLTFSPVDDRETTYFDFALLTAEGVSYLTIQGQGVIDGNRTRRGGPKTVAIKGSRHVAIRGITIANSPNYSLSLLGTDHVDIDGVTILNGYSDGIDPDCSRYVRIANSYIDAWDDAICPKSSQALGYPRATEYLTVTNCITRTSCNHFKMGTESRGGFRHITVSNLVMRSRDRGRPAISGIALETVDGAVLENVAISNVTMEDARTPIFLRLGNRGRGMTPPRPGVLRNIAIANVVASGGTLASSITGLPGHRVEEVTLSSIHFGMRGGGQTRDLEVPEHPDKYPDANMFGELPASGLYVRHAAGLVLRDVRVRTLTADPRPALVLDDVQHADVHGFAAPPVDGPQMLWRDVAGALVTGIRLTGTMPVFLRLLGAASRDVTLTGNDLRGARVTVEAGAGVPRGAWRQSAGLR